MAVVGEAGVGKSRLIYEFAPAQRLDGWRVLESAAVSYGQAMSYLPVIDLLKGYFAIQDRDDPRAIREKVTGKLLTLDAALEPTLPALLALLDVPVDDAAWQALDPPQRRQRTLDAVRRLLLREAREQPLLLIFEDLHWIDGETQALLDGLVETLGSARLLLLVSYRPEYQHRVGQQDELQPAAARCPARRAGGRVSGCASRGGRRARSPQAASRQAREPVLPGGDGPDPGGDAGAGWSAGRVSADTTGPGDSRSRPRSRRCWRRASIGSRRRTSGCSRPPRSSARTCRSRCSRRSPRPTRRAVRAGWRVCRRRSSCTRSSYLARRSTRSSTRSRTRSRTRSSCRSAAASCTRGSSTRSKRFTGIVSASRSSGSPITPCGASCGRRRCDYLRQAGRKAAARSALHEARVWFEQALGVLEALPESPSTLEQGFEIRLELRPVLSGLGEVRRALERLREAEALAERLNDDRRRGRVCAVLTNAHSHLGELDEALVTGTRALEIAGRLGDLRLRILTTTYLEQAHYFRGDYERVVELATDNLAALPADWVYESFGAAIPISIYDRYRLVQSLAELGRFAEAAQYETEALRLAEPTHHAYTVGMVHDAASWFRLLKGDWAKARSLNEHWVAVVRTGNSVLDLPSAVASSAWVLAQVGEASEALTRLREGEQLLDRHVARGTSASSGGPTTRWVVPLCCSAGSTRRGAWATARSSILRLTPGSRPMRCTCSATSRPIPTGSTPSAARPTTARRWRSPSRAACGPSSPTATSASASSTGAPANASRPTSTSPPRRRCTARWTCGSGSSREKRRWESGHDVAHRPYERDKIRTIGSGGRSEPAAQLSHVIS